MNIRFMRLVDRFAGIPLCWIMGLICHLGSFFRVLGNRTPVKNILVLKFFGLGSILLATPAIVLLKRSFPDAHITFVSFRDNEELLKRIGSVDSVLTVDNTSPVRFLRSCASVIRAIACIRPDVTFDFEFFSKFSTLLSGLSFSPRRFGFELPTQWRSHIVTDSVKLDRSRHVRFSFCEMVRLQGNISEETPDIEAPRITEQDIASLLQKFPEVSGRIVVVNVNAGSTFPERRWPASNFAELVARMSRDEEPMFYFVGSSKEHGYVQRVIGESGCSDRCLNVAGELTISELGALLQRAEILISNDSGPLHLASALGVRSIGLYGPESPEFYGPVQSGAIVIYGKTPCSPCMNIYAAKQFRCPYGAMCMHGITVNQVLKRIPSPALVEA